MDHLPSVLKPYQPIEVPYLGGKRYDGLDFLSYPTRQHWQVDALIQGDLQGRTPIEAAQFLQTWLYFGMIREALTFNKDDRIPWDDFVRVNQSSQSIISTSRLPDLLTALIAKLRAAKFQGGHRAYFERFRNCMERSCSVWKSIIQDTDGTAPHLLSPEIMLSIHILGEDLDIGITEICESLPRKYRYTWRPISSKFLIKRMVGQGWCPCIVDELSSPSTTFLYYASLLGPPDLTDHSHCSVEAKFCSAKNVDSGNYKIKHILESCKCNHIFIPTGEESKVADAIRDGHIPVIHVKDDGTNLLVDIDIHSRSNPVAYTAISHVWSDGLGNPEDNSMPYCQLKHVAKLVSELPVHQENAETNGTILPVSTRQLDNVSDCRFWMDTLCVPVSNMLLRNKAIVGMRNVYKLASNVLVLDAGLMKSSAERGFEEIFTRITCSTWVHRLWTLQEAILNNSLLFQFAERALYAGTSSFLFRAQSLEVSRNPWNLVAWECQGTSNKLGFKRLQASSSSNYIQWVSLLWCSLRHRSTSRVGDEPLCISILHDLDIEELQKPPHAGTVQKFWSLNVKGVPSYVLFLTGPKLTGNGYGWAPASLLDLKIIGTDFRMANITPRGLLVTYPGIILGQPHNPTSSIISCSVEGDTYYIRRKLANNSPSWDGLELGKCTNLAVIISPVIHSSTTTLGVKRGFDTGLGALVDIIEDGETKYVKYLRFITVLKKGSYRERNNNFPYTAVEIDEKAREPIEGRFLPMTRWCVG